MKHSAKGIAKYFAIENDPCAHDHASHAHAMDALAQERHTQRDTQESPIEHQAHHIELLGGSKGDFESFCSSQKEIAQNKTQVIIW
jgi:hypothetical protein